MPVAQGSAGRQGATTCWRHALQAAEQPSLPWSPPLGLSQPTYLPLSAGSCLMVSTSVPSQAWV